MPDNQLPIRDAKQLGAAVRAVRKAQHLRQDEVGRFSHSFIGDFEDGKPTAQVGKVLEVLAELGVKLILELPRGMNAIQLTRLIREGASR
jgi:transcriptional regulator with XRE-family HTH domain